jgi:ankyrin repeat protein
MRRKPFLIPVCITLALLAFVAPSRAMSESPETLITAIVAGDLSRVEKLLEEGASPNSRSEAGIPALAVAVGQKNAAIVKALLSKGAGPDARDGHGITPLMAAAYLGYTEMIPVLIEAKADLEARSPKGETALMFAAEGGRYEAARLLLDAGSEVDALGEQKASALMYAAQHGADDVVALLVERGADVNRKAAPGLTALDFARQTHQITTVALLESGGRQRPPALGFQLLRPLLYPESPLEDQFLMTGMEDEKLEAVRRLALKGELQQARDLLETENEESHDPFSYRWALSYLRLKLGDRTAALTSLHKLLTTPDLDSRETLRVWKLIRDLGEAPPPDLGKRVLGVVVESGLGAVVLAVASYADGQPRLFTSTGGGVIGETWTDVERKKTQEIVRLAQSLVDGMAPTEDRELPRPGRVRFIFLTPSGSYGAEESRTNKPGRYAEIVAANDQLFAMLMKRYQEAEGKKKP